MQLNAAKRLSATIRADEPAKPAKQDIVESSSDIEAAFDTSKDNDLRTIQQMLKQKSVIYKFEIHHLHHKTNPKDINDDIQITLEVLHNQGHNPKIRPGVLRNSRFALKSEQGLILQRIDHHLRIFFFV